MDASLVGGGCGHGWGLVSDGVQGGTYSAVGVKGGCDPVRCGQCGVGGNGGWWMSTHWEKWRNESCLLVTET